MNEEIRHRWGIIALAVSMFFVTMAITAVNGSKTSIYYFIWIMAGYYGYKNDLQSIKVLMKIVLWLNIIALILIMMIADNSITNDKTQLITSVIIMLVPKIGLFLYAKTNIEDNINTTVSDTRSTSSNFNNSKPMSHNKIDKKETNKSEEDLWELAYNEYNSENRKKGLYAKLLSQHEGDENKIKSSYIKERFEQLKAEELEKIEKNRILKQGYNKNLSAEECINTNSYTSKFYKDTEYLLFANGQAAIKINEKKYRLYDNDDSLNKSLNYHASTGMYLTTGLLGVIEPNDEKIVISCPRCKQKSKVPKNKELEISCPSCDFNWTEKT